MVGGFPDRSESAIMRQSDCCVVLEQMSHRQCFCEVQKVRGRKLWSEQSVWQGRTRWTLLSCSPTATVSLNMSTWPSGCSTDCRINTELEEEEDSKVVWHGPHTVSDVLPKILKNVPFITSWLNSRGLVCVFVPRLHIKILTHSSPFIRAPVRRGCQSVFGQRWQEHEMTRSPVCPSGLPSGFVGRLCVAGACDVSTMTDGRRLFLIQTSSSMGLTGPTRSRASSDFDLKFVGSPWKNASCALEPSVRRPEAVIFQHYVWVHRGRLLGQHSQISTIHRQRSAMTTGMLKSFSIITMEVVTSCACVRRFRAKQRNKRISFHAVSETLENMSSVARTLILTWRCYLSTRTAE